MKKILVIDDEIHLRELYNAELSDEGYQVILAKDGFEGIRLCEQQDPDLIIVDIRMPGMDGLETIARLLNINRSHPIIIHSAYPNYQDNFMSWNADAFIVKSGDLSDLKRKVNELLNEVETKQP
ncbi:MAG: response regulator [Candidatus Omnitrophota bacterium]|jgi:CheY-like chemotaxis protein|nr:MAG: response regulator [Candidatus Omnitrophota bacterium]